MSETGGAPSDRSAGMRFFWWVYFGLLVVMFISGILTFAADGFFSTLPATFLTALLLVHEALCIAGLYAYLRGVPLFAAGWWRLMLTLLLARIFVSASFLFPNLIAQEAGRERLVALSGLVLLALWGPLLVALWRYAFKSPHVWSRDSAL